MPIYGPDALFALHYEDVLLQSQPHGWCGGIFLRTAGRAHRTVQKIAKSKKFSEFLVHLAPFESLHEYNIKKLWPQIREDSIWLNGVAQRNKNTEFLLSPFCENKHRRVDLIPLFKELKKIAPLCTMVNSTMIYEEISGVITEIHLETSKLGKIPNEEYTVSFDGFGGRGTGDFPDADIPTILEHYSTARHIRWWNFENNGKYSHEDTTPIGNRKNFPSVEYMRGHNAMMKKREGAKTWGERKLYKSFADDHDGPQPKDNRAMCILPVNKESVQVRDKNKNVIDVMVRMRPDHANKPKGARFYSKLYAYQIGDLAEKNTGSRLISIDGSKLTDADLRSGLFK